MKENNEMPETINFVPKHHYECPDHGNIGWSVFFVSYGNVEHNFCIKCFDEFLQGKRNKVNFVKKIAEERETNAKS